MMDFFSWPWFAACVVIYSAYVCSGEMSKDGPLIFSKRNARKLTEIIYIHLAFLMVLLALMWFEIRTEPSMPNWMSEKMGRSGTFFDYIFIIAMIGLGYIERRWLFVGSDASDTDHDCDPS